MTYQQQVALEMLAFNVNDRVREDKRLRTYETEYPDRYYLRNGEWDETDLAQGRPIYNGCTHVWLTEKYGSCLHHHYGVGWYIAIAETYGSFTIDGRSQNARR